jgi:hypothetical protein
MWDLPYILPNVNGKTSRTTNDTYENPNFEQDNWPIKEDVKVE